MNDLKDELSSARILLEDKERELVTSQNHMPTLKENTNTMINDLEQQNLALRNELKKMKNALLNPDQMLKNNNSVPETKTLYQLSMETDEITSDDSEFTCHKCSFQTNSKESLNGHMMNAHSPQAKIKCDRCGQEFAEKNEVRKHIITNHKNFKPCRNYITEGNCRWSESCHFSHTPVKENIHRCYKCGEEVENINILMKHRKVIHNESCKDDALGRCRFNQETCYLNHQDGQKINNSNPKEDFCTVQFKTQPPGMLKPQQSDPASLLNVLK